MTEAMADEHFRTPALMPGTHCQNTCDKPLQSTFQALSKTFLFGQISRSAHCRHSCSMGYI